MENPNLQNDRETIKNKQQQRKWPMYILMIVLIAAVIGLTYNIMKERKDNPSKPGFFASFTSIFDSGKGKMDVKSFNFDFINSSGTKPKIFLSKTLDDVITSNKNNSEHLIFVVYNNINTSDVEEIKNIKLSLKDDFFAEYEVSVDYDEEGYVNKITIEEIKKDVSVENFNFQFTFAEGTKYRTHVDGIIDDIVTSNKKYSNHLVIVKFKDIETTNVDEIKSIKKSLKDSFSKYEISVDYDEKGYVNKITIEELQGVINCGNKFMLRVNNNYYIDNTNWI